ncbi:Probable ATP-dependent RNA helicase ddx46 [Sparganum proliferum]
MVRMTRRGRDRSPYYSSRRRTSRTPDRHRRSRHHRSGRSHSRSRSRSRSPRSHHHHSSSSSSSSSTLHALSSSTSLASLLAAQKAETASSSSAATTTSTTVVSAASRSSEISAVATAALSQIKAAQARSAAAAAANEPVSSLEGAIRLDGVLDKDAEQKRLDFEMQKRRERIERWRREKRLKLDVATAHSKLLDGIKVRTGKKWTLEDEEEEEEDNAPPPPTESPEGGSTQKDDEDEIDPLDAYMQEVNKEAQRLIEPMGETAVAPQAAPIVPQPEAEQAPADANEPSANNPSSKARQIGKGELIEAENDMPEYSSEEEEEDIIATALAQLQKKEKLGAVDHSRIHYPPFKKNFYVEVPEIAKMSKDAVKKYRASLEALRVRGKDCPKPVKTWVQTGVSSRLLACLKKAGFEKPTPIQCQALPVIMSGRDMIGIAKTGSGKTLAFLVPLMRHLEHQTPLGPGDGPMAILLTPTRELALQTYKEARRLGNACGFRIACVYGGTGISEQIAELKRGAEVIVCTPGRMIDMLAANGGRVTNLRRCTYVVLDEADRMFDLGFEPQVMRIVENCRPDRQTVMFSATFPRQMEVLARKALTNPIEVQVGGRSVVCSDITQKVWVLQSEEDKVLKLLELLGIYQEQGSVLVFVEKQESADELMRVLMNFGYPCLSLHGGIDQYDRDSVITDFKRGNIRLLIATSVAARGLDVLDLVLVVNYDCPNHYEDYVHRCGRTGRAGRKGYAHTFITPDQEKNAGDLVKAFSLSGQPVPEDIYLLYEGYKERMMMEGKKVYGGSGFRGKGFHFDEAEAQLVSDRKRFAKAALGIEDSDEEGDSAAVDWDSKIEDMFATKRKVTDVAKSGATDQPASSATAAPGPGEGLSPAVIAQLALARQKAAQVALKGLGNPNSGTAVNTSRNLAEQAAERLHAKLGYSKQQEEETTPAGSSSGGAPSDYIRRYEEELEINDFPQNVRWRITGREMLVHLNEYCDVGVSVRGIYIPTGKAKTAVPESSDERPLYLCLESTSERNIQLAKKEIMRIIKEELLKLQSSGNLNRGRYKVV